MLSLVFEWADLVLVQIQPVQRKVACYMSSSEVSLPLCGLTSDVTDVPPQFEGLDVPSEGQLELWIGKAISLKIWPLMAAKTGSRSRFLSGQGLPCRKKGQAAARSLQRKSNWPGSCWRRRRRPEGWWGIYAPQQPLIWGNVSSLAMHSS